MLISLKKTLSIFSLTTVALFAACSKDSDTEKDPDVLTKTSLKLSANAVFGSIITDGTGKSLYIFAPDASGSSTCIDGCGAVWPSFYAEDPTLPSGIAASDIGTITRADGKKQTTYKGWPLYYFASDAAITDVKGDGVGGHWFVAKPDYSIMLAEYQLEGNDGKKYLENAVEGAGNTQYLSDANGRTLYAFSPDTYRLNTYTKADLSNNNFWPIYESDVLNVPSVFSKDLFFQITSVGKKQLTYKGRPLYYFGPDTKRGDTKGVSVPVPGAWPILTKNTIALVP